MAGGASLSSQPSSSATSPTPASDGKASVARSIATLSESSTAASRAATRDEVRSAIARTRTPPFASARTPGSATGLPVRIVAPTSRPPANRSSEIEAGIRRMGTCCGSAARRRCSQASRAGPGPLLRTTPELSQSSANASAASLARVQAEAPAPCVVMLSRSPPRLDARGSQSRNRRADYA
jgi:hypothetical protein